VFLLGAAVFAMWFFLSLYLQQVRDYSPIRAGLAFLPMTLCIVATTTIVSRAVTRVGAKPLLVGGMAVLAAGLLLFTQLSPTGTYLGDILAPSLLVAIGLGLAFVPVTIAAVAGVDYEEAGLASGLVNTSRLFGGALGLAILAALATSRTNSDLSHAASGSVQTMHAALTSGFQLAFLISGLFAATGAVIALFGLPRVATGDGELVADREALAAGP
jgi:predicted MFS family arabinose efflux permease